MNSTPTLPGFQRLLEVIRRLRDPETGCPWDLKQTHESLRPYMLEEAYEAVEAMGKTDPAHLKEELGDVLLQVVLNAQLAADHQQFTADDVADSLADKLVRRHPHVFGDVIVDSPEAVTANWQQIKHAEKGLTEPPKSAMDGIPVGQPALSRALKVSRKAVAEGFEWPDLDALWACVQSEFDELRAEIDQDAPLSAREDELGDILFATVNLARFQGIDPEVALTRATDKFIRRYRMMEQLSEHPLNTQPFETLDALWQEAKRQTASIV